MITWKVENTNRLLTEVKNKFSGQYTAKEIRWSIDHNRCFVNKMVERFGSTVVKKGDLISIQVEARPRFTREADRVLFEDDHLLVYNKPPFITSEQLAALTHSLLVHRLDRDTSGVIVLAKRVEAQKALENQFRQRLVAKEYFAIVEGHPGKGGIITGKMSPIARREGGVKWGMTPQGLFSETRWTLIKTLGAHSLLRCHPLTGRTHQIRVHLAHLGHPIVGDPIYGSRHHHTSILRPLLHAHTLTLSQPPLTLTAPPPPTS